MSDAATGATQVAWPAYLPPLPLDGQRLVLPQYAGLGLANVGPTVLRILAGPEADHVLPPLAPGVLPEALARDVRAVVLLVADGLGHLQLTREVAAGNAPTLGRLLGQAAAGGEPWVSYAAITSVFPTTTVAALGSLNSAVAPVDHGLLGYTLYLEELHTVAEMIRWGPLDRRGSFADPELGGADPEAFLWAATIYRRLQAAGVERTFAVNPAAFAGTALTRMLHPGADYRGYHATSSLAVIVARLLRESSAPTYVYAYWPTIDTLSHLLGPTADEHGAEVAALDRGLERLLDGIPARGDTLVLLTADHGHVATSPRQEVLLNGYPELLALLAADPAGERRATYLHGRPGQAGALEACARAQLGEVAVALSRDEAARRGLFGPGPLPRRAAARIGDVLLLPRGNLQLRFDPPLPAVPARAARAGPPPPFRGLHGGLTPDEALVPLLAVRR